MCLARLLRLMDLRTRYTHMLSALACAHGFKNEVYSCVKHAFSVVTFRVLFRDAKTKSATTMGLRDCGTAVAVPYSRRLRDRVIIIVLA